MLMEREARIQAMENHADQVAALLADFSKSLEAYAKGQAAVNKLSDYYGSEEWYRDFEASNQGALPSDLKCGVLSEDQVYNLLTDNYDLAIRMLEIATQVIKNY
ncbi:DUF4298 domain-containing protein [Aerococcus loyolae]|uniref:DUF4298 domain-containing protein n=3 Tax=Lactobacillales TaxID=186826 RepID=A0A2I1LA21_9LACT|nr:DUF4298 domain-containing protein [Aerococcus loyolae]KAA9266843.1 DUF4298 domain-containing protein [Aerococcus loyolae]PKY87495.1 DUF4298 domain-containing protein [Aerococcus loyolae]PKZ04725.1 DUF4298 domain-containing protein [Aerococcus loyolae]RAV69006.1 DUF4298 domain-containing protein [Aerococcus loyolae]